jgi:hypothetical protein
MVLVRDISKEGRTGHQAGLVASDIWPTPQLPLTDAAMTKADRAEHSTTEPRLEEKLIHFVT